jgi:hypothetical protein
LRYPRCGNQDIIEARPDELAWRKPQRTHVVEHARLEREGLLFGRQF